MSKATIIFADGSKQMAHNLDDSRFRWYERRIAQSQDAYDLLATNQVVVRYGEPETYNQLMEYFSELKGQEATIKKIAALIKQEVPSTHREKALNATWMAVQEITRERQRLNVYREKRLQSVKPLLSDEHGAKLERIKAATNRNTVLQRIQIRYLLRYIEYLESVLLSSRVSFQSLPVNGKTFFDIQRGAVEQILEKVEKGELSEEEISSAIRDLAELIWGDVQGVCEKRNGGGR